MLYLDEQNLCATKLGKRTSELYIDPVSGVTIRDALKNKPPHLTELSLLHLITHTPDMGPVMRPYGEEIEILAVKMEQHREEFFVPPPTSGKTTSNSKSTWRSQNCHDSELLD